MDIKIPGLTQLPPINTANVHNRTQVKIQELHRLDQTRLDQYYKIKEQDTELLARRLKHYDLQKSLDELHRYAGLKKSVEYGLYQYSRYLGNKVDVYV